MPRGDQTGPEGMGPMSGRGAGFCAGYDMPGCVNPTYYRMRGRAWRRHEGHAMRHYGGHFGWMYNAAYAVPFPAEMSAEEKLSQLKTREDWLKEQLEEVHGDMERLQKEKPEKETSK
jgi:hypothetical protein